MGKVVLKDGRILNTTQQQQDSLAIIILTAPDLNRVVKIDNQTFKLSDIEPDPKKILALSQSKMFDIVPTKEKDGRQI